jgi:hypothetical protein
LGEWYVAELLLFLFLGTFCCLFFMPVQFVITYKNKNWPGRVMVELSFLNGLVRRKREIRIMRPKATGVKTKAADEGRWFFWSKRTSQAAVSPLQGNFSGVWELFDRFHHFGMGMTLLSYFLPARYHRWLLVAENLERRGEFRRLSWFTQIGTGDPALTAVGIGVIWGVKETLIGYLQSRYNFMESPEVNVSGNFQSISWGTAFNCIFRAKLGYIMIAALMVRLRHAWRKGGVGNE